jgi:predicted nucleic acid-binding protein
MILVDTWAWLALAGKRDQFHAVAKAQHQTFRKANRHYVTSDFILTEVISRLYSTTSATKAQSYIQALLSKADAGDYLLVHVSPQQFRRAWQMRQKYDDKPDISFMQDLSITEVFTGDAHFQQVNLGFHLLP